MLKLGAVSARGGAGRSAEGPVEQSGLAVYCNSAERAYENPGSKQWVQQMRDAIARDGKSVVGTEYVYGPQAMEVQLSVDKEQDATQNRSRIWAGNEGSSVEMALSLVQITAHARRRQVLHGVYLVSWMAHVHRWMSYEKRPKCELRGQAREWWHFAGACVLTEIRDHKSRLSLELMHQSLAMAKQYVQLRVRHGLDGRERLIGNIPAVPLNSAEELRLLEIEDGKFKVETLMSLRKIAWAQLYHADTIDSKKRLTKAQIKIVNPQWAVIGKKAIEYSEGVCWMRVRMQVNGVNFKLTSHHSLLLEAELTEFNLGAHMQGNGAGGMSLDIGSLEVKDRYTVNALFPDLVSLAGKLIPGQPLVHLHVEKTLSRESYGTKQDLIIGLQTLPLQIVFNYNLLSVLQEFAREAQDVDFDGVRIKTSNAFEDMYNNYLTSLGEFDEGVAVVETQLSAHCSVGGPVLLLPQHTHRGAIDQADGQSNVLVFDTGTIHFNTVQNDAAEDYSSFGVETHGMELFYVPCLSYVQRQPDSDVPKSVLIDAACVEGNFQVCTKAFDTSLTKVISKLELSSTVIDISDVHVKVLADIVAVVLTSQPKVPEAAKKVRKKTPAKQTAAAAQGGTSTSKVNKLLLAKQLAEEKAAKQASKARQLAENKKRTMAEHAERFQASVRKKRVATASSSLDLVQQPASSAVVVALRQWKLLDFTITVKDITASVRTNTHDIVLLKMEGMSATLMQRPLDQTVQFEIQSFIVDDCLQRHRQISHALLLECLTVNLLKAQQDSPAADGTAVENVTATLSSADTGFRFGLIKELSDFGVAASSCVELALRPEQATVDVARQKLLVAERTQADLVSKCMFDSKTSSGALVQAQANYEDAEEQLRTANAALAASTIPSCSSIDIPSPGASSTTASSNLMHRAIKLKVVNITARLVPEVESQDAVAVLQVQQVLSDVDVSKEGSVSVVGSVRDCVISHNFSESSKPKDVGSNADFDELVLTIEHDDCCIKLEYRATSPDVARPTKHAKLDVNNLQLMLSTSFVADTFNWATHNPLVEALNSKAPNDQHHKEHKALAKKGQQAAVTRSTQNNAALPCFVIEGSLNDVSILVPNPTASNGVRMGLKALGLHKCGNATRVEMHNLCAWSYVGQYHSLREKHADNRHMVLAEPVSMQVAIHEEDSMRSLTVTPGVFCVRMSYCDMRLLGQLAASAQSLVTELSTPTAVSVGGDVSDTSEECTQLLTPVKQEPQPTLVVSMMEPLHLEADIFDDEAGRNQARQLFGFKVCATVHEMALSDKAHINVGIEVQAHHFDPRGVPVPLLEPCTVIAEIDGASSVTSITMTRQMNFVVTAPLLVDVIRIQNVWVDQWQMVESAGESAADYESIVVNNESGLKLLFGKNGEIDLELQDGDSAELNGFETSVIHVQPNTNSIVNEVARSPLGDVSTLGFKCSGLEFDASTKLTTVHHHSSRPNVHVAVNVEKVSTSTVMRVCGMISFQNSLAATIHVRLCANAPEGTTLYAGDFAANQVRGLPSGVSINSVLEISRGGSPGSVDLQALLKRPEGGSWIRVSGQWICVSARSQRVRSRAEVGASVQRCRVWVTTYTIEVRPAIEVINMLPMQLELSVDVGSTAISECCIDAGGGRQELVLFDVDNADNEGGVAHVRASAKLCMHDVCYATKKKFTIHSTSTDKVAETFELTSTGGGSLPILLDCVHDVAAVGSRVIRIMAAAWLENTSGFPIQVCNASHYGKGAHAINSNRCQWRGQDCQSLPRTEVTEWMHNRTADVTLLPNAKLLRLKLSLKGSLWSDAFAIDHLGAGGLLEMTEAQGAKQFGVAVTSTLIELPDSQLRPVPPTKVVRIYPRWVFGNHLDFTLELAQASDLDDATVDSPVLAVPGEVMPGQLTSLAFSCTNTTKTKLLKIRQKGGNWCGHFHVDEVQQFPVWLRGGGTVSTDDVLVHVTVRCFDCVLFVHVNAINPEWPIFRLRVHTSIKTITARQVGSMNKCCVQGGGEQVLGWDLPLGSRTFELEVPSSDGTSVQKVVVRPENVAALPHQLGIPLINVTVEGPTRTIEVGIGSHADVTFAPLEPSSTLRLQLCQGAGLSVVGAGVLSRPAEEILTVGLGKITVDAESNSKATNLEVSVSSLQIDSMLKDVSFPVVLRVLTGADEPAVEESAVHTTQSALHMSAIIKRQPVSWTTHLDAVSVLLQAVNVQVELALVERLLEFAAHLKISTSMQMPDYAQTREKRLIDTAAMAVRSDEDEPVLFIRLLQLHPLSFNITGRMGKGQASGMASGFAWLELNQAPVRLHGLVLENLCGFKSEVTSVVGAHFAQEAKWQIYKIIGSVGILGNPVGLVNKLGSGVYSFFYEPINGIAQGPSHFAAGLAKGTLSLLDGTVAGGFHAPTEIASALAQQARAIADTDSHAGSGEKASSVQQGLEFAAKDMATDLHKIATSLFMNTAHGVASEGAVGLVKGLAHGLVETGGATAALGLDLTTNLTAAAGHILHLGMLYSSRPMEHS